MGTGCPSQAVASRLVDSRSCFVLGIGVNNGSNVRVDAFTMEAVCARAGTPAPAPVTWTEQAKLCGAGQSGGGCASGRVCLPKVSTGQKLCAFSSGVNSCPSGFTPEGSGLWYSGLDDTRDCGSVCPAASPSGGSCGTSYLALYGGNLCAGAATNLQSGVTCAFSAPTGLQSGRVILQGETPPACTAPPPAATGSATATGAMTVCCA
jgi:hypothetical protein